MSNNTSYFSVVIPFAKKGASEWHPTTSVGPFSTLTRGAFDTEEEAREWAGPRLNGLPYSVKEYAS